MAISRAIVLGLVGLLGGSLHDKYGQRGICFEVLAPWFVD